MKLSDKCVLVKCLGCGWFGLSLELDGVNPPNAESEDEYIDVCPECMQAKHLVKNE